MESANVEGKVLLEVTEASTSTTIVRKRQADGQLLIESSKKQKIETTSTIKVFPIFNKSEPEKQFRFLKNVGGGSVLHGIHLNPSPAQRVAAFDLDGTLIRTKNSSAFPRGAHDWKWWKEVIPETLSSLHEQGYSIVIFSNQAALKGRANKRRDAWQRKISLIAAEIPTIPFRIFAATEHDQNRKPNPGMWSCFEAINGTETIDKKASFFVGDAAGRPSDHSDVDKLFASAIKIRFYTPEKYFNVTS